jgi:hypothetical protein
MLLQNTNNHNNKIQLNETSRYNHFYFEKYFFSSILDMSSKSYLDDSTYFEGLFNLFVIHDGQLQINFETSSLMNSFKQEEKSITSFHQVLTGTDLSWSLI